MTAEDQWLDYDEQQLATIARKDVAASQFVAAIRNARIVCQSAGLNGEVDDEGNLIFQPQQTARAVRHAREDASATLALQLFIMRRLDRNRNYMIVIILLLIYLAWNIK